MAQDLLSKKRDFCSHAVIYAAKVAALTRDLVELGNFWTDNGFAAAGANPIVQADLDGTDVAHLTPAMLAAFITAIGTVNLNAGQRSTMRQVAKDVVPKSV